MASVKQAPLTVSGHQGPRWVEIARRQERREVGVARLPGTCAHHRRKNCQWPPLASWHTTPGATPAIRNDARPGTLLKGTTMDKMRVLTLLTMAFATFTMWLPNGYWWARALVTTSLVVSVIIDIIHVRRLRKERRESS